MFRPLRATGAAGARSAALTREWEAPDYDFHQQGYYQSGKQGAGEPVFTEPYYEVDGTTYMTLAQAFRDRDGRILGVISVDMVLPLIQELIAEANQNPAETVYVTTAQKRLFVHPDEADLLDFARDRNPPVTNILDLTVDDLAAFDAARDTAPRYRVSTRVKNVDWSVQIASDRRHLFSEARQLRFGVLVVVAVLWGLTAIAFGIWRRTLMQRY
ncbi:MAG: hypothetical protein HC838_09390, partial [Spirulinaceae cyanobacterium RM2_2_10]|nr:hypothetical protein [Spirulinaceae cyanobacterium RM2_2_10]